ncbi:hypothetical protein SAMN05216233_109169 [Desulfoluna spongiiphila]|uniref:Uncharacterized protein n=1 Tax=Desulfoluna spongiiphila TaxID=419481 RepID=A0A1G5G2E9_9BACT|nr:hypothetical protein SAMN05216233_109169 [Desulfoluna spongiiphila]
MVPGLKERQKPLVSAPEPLSDGSIKVAVTIIATARCGNQRTSSPSKKSDKS